MFRANFTFTKSLLASGAGELGCSLKINIDKRNPEGYTRDYD